jgi:uncharacterized phage-associated protein
MNRLKTCVQALHYLLTKLGTTDKLKLVKLMFLADKLHLIRYGRTITGDTFLAIPNGPVGSMAKDVLSGEMGFLSQNDHSFCEQFIEQSGNYDYRTGEKRADFGLLSKSDYKILDEIILKFGKFDKWQLVKLTHKYPEWAQFENVMDSETIRCKSIELHELFSTIPDDPLGVTQKMVDEAKDIFLG